MGIVIQVTLKDETHDALVRLSKERSLSVSSMGRLLIEQTLGLISTPPGHVFIPAIEMPMSAERSVTVPSANGSTMVGTARSPMVSHPATSQITERVDLKELAAKNRRTSLGSFDPDEEVEE